ncbi:ABC transporter ATP-binding protein [Mesorhizobium marinum]|uniref:ABC transporter ATP-binding protein n=1 Tax=Mesorhizobium marinum TaxID=3228790 RepID=UPI003465E853
MVFVRASNVGLRYPIPRRVRLRGGAAGSVGGRFQTSAGGSRYVTALDGISFELGSGDRLGLVGTNGAGKTTLLKVLYGIYAPTSGTMETQGRVDALFNINLGFRAQATGRRNIVLRGLIAGWSMAEIETRMDDIIAFSELGDFIDMPFDTYSQGMGARLAFAIATGFQPEILLMDEWIGAGDKAFQDKAKTRLEAMVDKAGIIVLASHNDDLIKRVCNKIMTLENGRVASLDAIG